MFEYYVRLQGNWKEKDPKSFLNFQNVFTIDYRVQILNIWTIWEQTGPNWISQCLDSIIND